MRLLYHTRFTFYNITITDMIHINSTHRFLMIWYMYTMSSGILNFTCRLLFPMYFTRFKYQPLEFLEFYPSCPFIFLTFNSPPPDHPLHTPLTSLFSVTDTTLGMYIICSNLNHFIILVQVDASTTQIHYYYLLFNWAAK